MSDRLNVNIIDEQSLNINLSQESELNIAMQDSEDTLQVELITNANGVSDYPYLTHKPSINGVVLVDDKSFEELGREDITNRRIREIIDEQYNTIFGGTS